MFLKILESKNFFIKIEKFYALSLICVAMADFLILINGTIVAKIEIINPNIIIIKILVHSIINKL